MKKMWIALVVTNATWAGWAMSQSAPGSATQINQGYVRVGEGPTGQATGIRVDKDGYVICSTERKP